MATVTSIQTNQTLGTKLTVITTSRILSDELVKTVNSTERSYVREHIVSYSDESILTADEFVRRCKGRVQLIYSSGCKIAKGFNLCLERVSPGDYVVVLNEGDELLDVSTLLVHLERHPALEAVVGGFRQGEKNYLSTREISFKNAIWHGMGFEHSTCIVRGDFHQRYGTYPESYAICMDYALMLRALKRGACFQRLAQIVVEIEKPGVSSNILARSRENRKIIQQYVSYPVSWILWMKWVINSSLASLI